MVDGTERTTFFVPQLDLSALNVQDENGEARLLREEPRDTNGLMEQTREASLERLRAAGLLDETGALVPRRKVRCRLAHGGEWFSVRSS
mmetsp:Transcript_5612/g.34811  ORF Transcript_5612/g.34811 Transcript_5612/m.34811 type:complete len:89 (-) Transcript_5612:407-673(-)